MIPIRVSLAGFLSYRERQELYFDGAPLWVLTGPNGSGKSAVFDAVTFALFGEARDGVRDADLINRRSDNLEVEFDFRIDESVYRVRRTRSRRGRPTFGAFRLGPVEPDGPETIDSIPDTTNKDDLNRWVRATVGLGFDAFTASVLLRQGKSDRLLEVQPKDRFDILSELVDLSEYRRLHDRVEDCRRHWDARARSLNEQLQAQSVISDDALAEATAAVEQAEAAFQTARDDVAELGMLLGWARQWEELQQTLESIAAERDEDAPVLVRSGEILEGYKRRGELERVLPDVEQVVEGRTRTAELRREMDQLDQLIGDLDQQVRQAEVEHREAIELASELQIEFEEIQGRFADLASEQARLAPLVSRLEELERLDEEVARSRSIVAELPSDLDALIAAVTTQSARLSALDRELPALETLAEARTALIQYHHALTQAEADLVATDEHWKAAERQVEVANDHLTAVRVEEQSASNSVAGARTEHRLAGERLVRFDATVLDARCGVCGQPVTAEHAASERSRLVAEAGAAEHAVVEATERLEKATRAARSHQAALDDATTERDDLERRRRSFQDMIKLERHRVDDNLTKAERAYARLAPNKQVTVADVAPIGVAGWLVTSYPTGADLDQVRLEIAELDGLSSERERLETLVRSRDRALEQERGALTRIREVEADTPRESLQAAREQSAELAELQPTLEMQLTALRDFREGAAATVSECCAALDNLRSRLTEYRGQRRDAELRANAGEASVTSAWTRLPVAWQCVVDAAEPVALDTLYADFASLVEYPDLWEKVVRAQERAEAHQRRETECHAKIADLPEAARRAAAALECELEAAKGRLTCATDAHREATAAQTRLTHQKQQRQQTEAAARTADRQVFLHRTLASLLGREGLQLALLRQAEAAIVERANEILDRLSEGRMRLCLRVEEQRAGKALDLLYDDRETDAEASPIGLSSGSQRFRIALSLALAIGRYLGEAANQVRSVIVDEGFGSLDRVGRVTMIQEFTLLQTELDRIILVSHQEEIAEAFHNAYSIALVAGASRVSLAGAE